MSGYIMELRKLVGHRLLMQIGASVIVEDERGRILLERRRDDGCWCYPGGSVEPDERVEDAACRELLEETGLKAQGLRLYGVFSGSELHHVYPNGDEVSNVDVVFVCRDFGGTLRPQPDEVTALEFFAPDALPEPIFPPVRETLLRWAAERNAPSGAAQTQVSP